MREIKFRGKCLGNGEWVYGDLLQVANEVFIAPSDGDWFDFIPWSRNNVFHLPAAKYAVIPNTIGQFTGLHDKNGKEIYEGDVLFVREWENLAMRVFVHEERELFSLEDCKGGILHESQRVVYFEEGSMCAGDYYMCTLSDGRDQRHQYPIFEVELLGNIHDNPELLNK